MHFQLRSKSQLNDGSWRDEPEVHFICKNFHQLLDQLRKLATTLLQDDQDVTAVQFTAQGQPYPPVAIDSDPIIEHWSVMLRVGNPQQPECKSLVASFTRQPAPEEEPE